MRRIDLLSLVLGAVVLAAGNTGLLRAKDKTPAVNPNDPTYKLYARLDSGHNGKLDEFYFLADEFKDSEHPGETWQHVILAEYNKSLFFGKFKMTVHSISKPTPDQLKVYTVKALYDFGSDSEKFAKINPGPLGQEGDLYMVAKGDNPMKSAPITPDVQAEYEKYVSQYLLPALEKSKD
jgi:hypothetical protein